MEMATPFLPSDKHVRTDAFISHMQLTDVRESVMLTNT